MAFFVGLGRAAYVRDRAHRVLKHLAHHRGGAAAGRTIMLPGVEAGTTVKAHWREHGWLFWKHFSIEFEARNISEPELSMTIRRRGVSHLLRGLKRLRTRDRKFDRRFIVYGEPKELALQQLAPGVRSRLLLLAETWNRRFRIAVGDGHWRIAMRRPESAGLEFVKSVDIIFDVLDVACSVLGRGVEIVKESRPDQLRDATCQVCGESLESDIVFCWTCQTPHHRDCWKFVGHCSVFACGGKRARTKLRA